MPELTPTPRSGTLAGSRPAKERPFAPRPPRADAPVTKVQLRIDALVLSGIDRRQQPALLAALQQALQASLAQLGTFGGKLELRRLRLSAPAHLDGRDASALASELARQIIEGALLRRPRGKGVGAERESGHG